jgi:alkylated DNA repair protein (DNA oxidative demethylase)
MDSLIPRPRGEIAPGAVHLPDWLDVDAQRELVAACRGWATERAGFGALRLPNGGVMSVRMVCLGWNWVPYRYSRTLEDGSPVTPFPDWLAELGQRAVAEAYGEPSTGYRPDVALVNYYDEAAKMGLHQDRDERSLEPVVSLSLGNSCVFRFGNTENRSRPWTDIELCSGDLFVFGGPSRLAFHGVTKTLPGTGNPDIGLPEGRLNITLRVSGMP